MTDGSFGGQADERELLTGFLDWYRAVVARKVDGLSVGEAARRMTASGLTPLGVVKHLAWGERHWFEQRFAGAAVDLYAGPDLAPTFALDSRKSQQGARADCRIRRFGKCLVPGCCLL